MDESDNIASAVREHAERILRAKGTSLRNYMPQSQADILAAVLDCYEAGYRAGAVFATKEANQ
jgi:hypothetical protein